MQLTKFKVYGSRWIMVIFFIGLGVFNSVTTWIAEILRPRGFSATQAGTTRYEFYQFHSNSPSI